MKRVLVFSIIAVLFVAGFVYALGGSTGGTYNPRSEDSDNDTTNTTKVNCEDKTTVEERIECRLENRDRLISNSSNIPEPCRNIDRQAGCVALYRSAVGCYDTDNARDKKVCFLRVAGILQGGTLRAANNEVKGNYAILLLYEVQNRIETMQENGFLTVDEATPIIAKIVEIKQDILNGKTRAEVMPKIRELKTMYFEAIQ